MTDALKLSPFAFLVSLAGGLFRPFLHAGATALCIFAPPSWLARRAEEELFPFDGALLFRAALAPAVILCVPLFFWAKSVTGPDFVKGALDSLVTRDLLGPQENVGRLTHILSRLPAFHIDAGGLVLEDNSKAGVPVTDPYSGMAVFLADPRYVMRAYPASAPTAAVMLLRDGMQARIGSRAPISVSYVDFASAFSPEATAAAWFTDMNFSFPGASALDLLNVLGDSAGKIPPLTYARGVFSEEAPANGARSSVQIREAGRTKGGGPLIFVDLRPAVSAPDPETTSALLAVTRSSVYVRRRVGGEFTEIFSPETDRESVALAAGQAAALIRNGLKWAFWPCVFPAVTAVLYAALRIWRLAALAFAYPFFVGGTPLSPRVSRAGALCAMVCACWCFPALPGAIETRFYIAVAIGMAYYVCWRRRAPSRPPVHLSTSSPA